MFCKKCNTELKSDDKFCANCGLAVDPNNTIGNGPLNATLNFKSNNSVYLKEILRLVKNMISNPLETINAEIKNISKECSLLLASLNLLLFALLNTLFIKVSVNNSLSFKQQTSNIINNDIFALKKVLEQSQKIILESFSYIKLFFCILISTLVFLAIMLLLAYIVFKLIGKQEDFNIIYALNCISLSSITLIIFMLLGLILSVMTYNKFGLFIIAIGNITFIIILFSGFKSLSNGNNLCQLLYLYAFSIVLGNFIFFQIVLSFIKSAFQQIMRNMLNF